MILTVQVINENGNAENIQIGDIVINNTSNSALNNQLSATIDDGGEADISVTLSGHESYSTKITNVYNQDKTIQITMFPKVTDIESSNYNRPYPRFFTFMDPCSFKVDFYKASGDTGETSWYIDNNLLCIGQKSGSFITEGPTELQLKIQETVSTDTLLWERFYANTEEGNTSIGVIADIQTYLSSDTETNLETIEYRPEFSVVLESPKRLLLKDGDSFVRDETVTVVPSVNISKGDLIDYNVSIKVTAPRGNIVLEETVTLQSLSTWEFQMTEIGDYIVSVFVNDLVCGLTYERELIAQAANFIDIQYSDCNLFTIYNRSTYITPSFTVSKITGEEVIPRFDINPNSSSDITLPDTSIYQVDVVYSKEVEGEAKEFNEIYFISNYCELENCISSYIEAVICGKTSLGSPVNLDKCNPCPDEVELNQMLLLSYTFFMKLNSLYIFNNFYTGLEDSDIAEVMSINNIGEKLSSFCKRRGCIKTESSSFGVTQTDYKWTDNNKDCGCS